jgi:transaldolase
MKIWLDTTNLDVIEKALRFGILYGITTNPTLIAQSGKKMDLILKELLDVQNGPVTAQVIASDVSGMVEQAKNLNEFSERIIVKIPASQEGLEAIHILSNCNIPTMATVVFKPNQALVSALSGVNYVAPYISQIEKSGHNPWEILNSILTMIKNYSLKTEILAASLSSLEHIQKCAELGIPHITIKDPLFNQLVETVPLTHERIQQFALNWEASKTTFIVGL